MRKMEIRVSLLLISFLGLIQFGCGSETPFKRGANSIVTPPPVAPFSGRSEPPPPPAPPKGLNKEFFDQKVLKGFQVNCIYCHNGIKQVHVADTFETASKNVVVENPDKSNLYLAASGQKVGNKNHKPVAWGDDPAEVENLNNLKAWIMGATLADGNKLLDLAVNQNSNLTSEDITLSRVLDNDPIPNPSVIGELNQTYFDSKVLGLMEDSCTMCHDNPAPDYNVALTKVVFGKPEESLLYLAGSGQILPTGWKHKNIWRNNPDNLEILKSWIMGAGL